MIRRRRLLQGLRREQQGAIGAGPELIGRSLSRSFGAAARAAAAFMYMGSWADTGPAARTPTCDRSFGRRHRIILAGLERLGSRLQRPTLDSATSTLPRPFEAVSEARRANERRTGPQAPRWPPLLTRLLVRSSGRSLRDRGGWSGVALHPCLAWRCGGECRPSPPPPPPPPRSPPPRPQARHRRASSALLACL